MKCGTERPIISSSSEEKVSKKDVSCFKVNNNIIMKYRNKEIQKNTLKDNKSLRTDRQY